MTREEFSAAEQALVEDVVRATNRALEDGLSPHRAATILQATAACTDTTADPAPIHERFRQALANPGSYLPAASDGGER